MNCTVITYSHNVVANQVDDEEPDYGDIVAEVEMIEYNRNSNPFPGVGGVGNVRSNVLVLALTCADIYRVKCNTKKKLSLGKCPVKNVVFCARVLKKKRCVNGYFYKVTDGSDTMKVFHSDTSFWGNQQFNGRAVLQFVLTLLPSEEQLQEFDKMFSIKKMVLDVNDIAIFIGSIKRTISHHGKIELILESHNTYYVHGNIDNFLKAFFSHTFIG